MVSKAYNGFPAQYRDKQGGKIYKAFKSGELTRPDTCIMCGLTAKEATIHAHNEDYHNPDTFVGVCYYCHMAVHKRFSSLQKWYKWRELVCTGWQPPRNRDYRVFVTVWDGILRVTGPEMQKDNYLNWSWTLPDEEPDLYSGQPENSYNTEAGLFDLGNDKVTTSQNNPT